MKRKQVWGIILCSLISISFELAHSATLNVNGASQLSQALANARGGDVISVAAGVNLGNITIDGGKYSNLRNSQSMITIQSASATNPARIQQIHVVNVKNLRFSKLLFACTSTEKKRILFESSQNIEVMHAVFQGIHGQKTNGPHFSRIINLTVEDNDFLDLWSSMSVGNSTHVLVSNNQFLRGSFDSIHLGSSMSDVMIANNVIRATPTNTVKHVDLIQVINMTSGKTSEGITFRNNDIRATNGVGIHGIYFGNYDAQHDGGKDKTDWYKDILIEGNYIETTQMAGIAVSYAQDVTIRKNVVTRPAGSGKGTRKINQPTILVEVTNAGVTILSNETYVKPIAGHLMDAWRSLPIPGAWNTDF
jgi:hypothetical protein